MIKKSKMAFCFFADFFQLVKLPLFCVVVSGIVDFCLRYDFYFSYYEAMLERGSVPKFLGAWIVLTGASLFLLTFINSIPKIGTFLFGFLFASSCIFCFSYLKIQGDFPNDVDFSTAISAVMYNFEEIVEAFSMFASFEIIGICGLLLICLFGICFFLRPSRLFLPKAGYLTLGVLCLPAIALYVAALLRLGSLSLPLEPFSHIIQKSVVYTYNYFEFETVPRDSVPMTVIATSPTDSILLIVDESIRGDYIDFNHPGLGITPWLKEYAETNQESVFNYSLMISTTTCSSSSGICILTGVSEFPDIEKRALRNPTLFDFAKRSGYKTTLITVAHYPDSIIRKKDMASIDRCIPIYTLAKERINVDMEAAKLIRDLLDETGQFIVLFKTGAHFDYENAYPSNDPIFRRFEPTRRQGDSTMEDTPEERQNSYKNALSFNLDSFFSILLERFDHQKTTILWTSDHGQSLLEDINVRMAHCGTLLEQAIVPFVVFTTVPWVREQLVLPESLNGHALSQFIVYPTLVSIMTRDRNYKASERYSSILSDPFVIPPLRYIYGSLWNASAGKVYEVSNDDLDRYR